MQKNLNILQSTLLAVLFAVMTTGCIKEDYGSSLHMQSVMVQLDVSAGKVLTKVDYESPTEEEAKINTLRVYAFYGGRQVGYHYQGNVTEGQHMFMDLSLPKTGVHEVSFYLVANEASMRMTEDSPALSEEMTTDQLDAIRFDALTQTSGLPMYCIRNVDIDVDKVSETVNDAAGHNGHMILEGSVKFELTRPVAKLAVYAAKMTESSVINVSKVSMTAKGTRLYNYLLPQEESVLKTIGSRANNRIFLEGDVSLSKALTDAGSRLDTEAYDELVSPSYLSEVPYGSTDWNVVAEGDAVVLEIEYSTGSGTEISRAYVNMPVIERNNYYKVLCLINAEGKMTISYIVEDWNDAEMWDGGLVFDYPSHSYIRPSFTDNSVPSSKATMTYGEGSDAVPFKGYFQMIYPVNETWTPTLLDGTDQDYDVEVWTSDGGTKVNIPVFSSDDWYMIKVIPKNPANNGKTVKLAITYTPNWSDEAEFLLINGAQGDYFWPYDDSSQNDPNYVIITQQ